MPGRRGTAGAARSPPGDHDGHSDEAIPASSASPWSSHGWRRAPPGGGRHSGRALCRTGWKLGRGRRQGARRALRSANSFGSSVSPRTCHATKHATNLMSKRGATRRCSLRLMYFPSKPLSIWVLQPSLVWHKIRLKVGRSRLWKIRILGLQKGERSHKLLYAGYGFL